MTLLSETINDLRGMIMRGIVVAVRDTGQMQVVDVETHDGAVRADIEVYQPFGFAACPVAVGSVALLLAVGGDPGDLVALAVATPSLRFGAQAPGETTIYAGNGCQVGLRAGGTVEIIAAAAVVIQAGGDVLITGNVTVDGNISSNGEITDAVRSMAADRALYNAHTHGVDGSVTTTPSPTE